MVISSICACTGQLMWKISEEGNLLMLLCGFTLYGCGALFMIFAYRHGSLSVLQPILGLNYVLCLLLGSYVLDEVITADSIIGCLMIIIGIWLIAIGDK